MWMRDDDEESNQSIYGQLEDTNKCFRHVHWFSDRRLKVVDIQSGLGATVVKTQSEEDGSFGLYLIVSVLEGYERGKEQILE